MASIAVAAATCAVLTPDAAWGALLCVTSPTRRRTSGGRPCDRPPAAMLLQTAGAARSATARQLRLWGRQGASRCSADLPPL